MIQAVRVLKKRCLPKKQLKRHEKTLIYIMGTSLPAAFETAQTDANCKFARLHRQPVKDRSSLSFVTVTVSMAMAVLRLDYNGVGEGVPNVPL